MLLAYTFGRYGFASLDRTAMEYNIVSSFSMMAGAAAFLAGRSLNVQATHLTRTESRLWVAMATVCLIGGLTIVIATKLQLGTALVDEVTMGVGGAFFIMLGVLCLVGQRVMSHMHDAWVLTAEEREKLERQERAKAEKAYAFFGDKHE
ncbi:MAG: hypothetical protein ACXVZJ_08035 [Terriglobales bacterium]